MDFRPSIDISAIAECYMQSSHDLCIYRIQIYIGCVHSVVALSFHPAFYPPKSGGELRLFHIYKNLSRRYAITLITFTYPNLENSVEIIEHNPSFKEIRIPKTRLNAIFHHIIQKCSSIQECSAIVTSLESRVNKNFQSVVLKEVSKAETIIFVYPYLYTVPAKLLDDKKIVYESHNFEYELMEKSLDNSLIGKILKYYTYYTEKKLSRRADLIFTVSEENKEKIADFYGLNPEKIQISPNGVDTDGYSINIREMSGHPVCIFIGSYHPPNIEAANAIVSIAHQIPDITFIIAGNVSQYFIGQEHQAIEKAVCPVNFRIEDSGITLHDGFHTLEYWDSIPTIWTLPKFSLHIPDGVKSFKIRAYSDTNQKLTVSTSDRGNITDLHQGWNEINLQLHEEIGGLCKLSCEKQKSDGQRTLGIAIQEIQYSKGGEGMTSLDLKKSPSPTYAFKNAKNVYLVGQIEEEEKSNLYRHVDIAINPMISGSGTNIKMLDYMAAGLPVVTTPIGARGLDIRDHHDAIICSLQEFPERIQELIRNNPLREDLIHNGRMLVEKKYDWKMIAQNMSETLEAQYEKNTCYQ